MPNSKSDRINRFKSRIGEFLALGYGKWFNMLIVLIIGVGLFVYKSFYYPQDIYSYDTEDYYFTWWTYLGIMDMEVRTPLYPIFIGSLTSLFGMDRGELIAMWLQMAFRIISMYYLWRICKLTGLKNRYSFWLVAVWYLAPYLLFYNFEGFIITESLSMTMTIFYVWAMLTCLHHPSKWMGVWVSVWTFMLVLLRPANLTLFVATLLYFFTFYKMFKPRLRTLLPGVLLTLFFIGYIAAYQLYTEHLHGNGAYTNVSAYNNLYLLKEADLLKPEYIDHPEARRLCEEYQLTGDKQYLKEIDSIFYDFPYFVHDKKVTAKAFRAEPLKLVPALKVRFTNQLRNPMVYGFETLNHPRATSLIPPIWFAYLLTMGYFILSAANWRKGAKEYGYEGMLLCTILLMTMATSFVGAQAEWGRLNIHMMFIAFIAFCQLLQCGVSRVKTLICKWKR